MKIQEIYEELKQEQLCKTGYDFSRDYFNKDRSYYSVLKAKDMEPSIEALVMLNFALQRRERIFGVSEFEQVREKASKLNALQAEVSEHIVRKCQENIRQ